MSADKLIEWPAQLKACGDFANQRVLDIGCGTGDKARYLADHGAASVIGIDASSGFADHWEQHRDSRNLQLLRINFEELATCPPISTTRFDLIVSFQVLMYASHLNRMVQTLAGLLTPGGALVFSVPHPFRFAVLRAEREGWGCGFAYQQAGPYRYPSPWDAQILLEHATPRISDYLNAITLAGLRLTLCKEPSVTNEFRKLAPGKAAWIDRYVGVIIFRAERDRQLFLSILGTGDMPLIGWFLGGRGRNRTYNLSIKSRMLCQLSYASTKCAEKPQGTGRRTRPSFL